MTSLGWYVVKTEPRAERLAVEELRRDKIKVLFPKVKNPNPLSYSKEIPLFPGYLFLRCDPEHEGWPTFRPAHRILGWLGYDNEIPPVPDECIKQLMERIEEINSQGGMQQRFQRGDKVEVVAHVIKGFAEVMAQSNSTDARVSVLFQFLGRPVTAVVPWQNLRSIESEPFLPSSPPRRTRGKGRWIR